MKEKYCSYCEKTLPVSNFGKNSSKKDKLQSRCKKCRKEENNNYYNNSEKRRNNIKENREKLYKSNKEFLDLYKLKTGCMLCEEKELCTLDFHHVNQEEKDFTISNYVHKKSIENLMKEVEKCIVVCSNCHRKIHTGIIKGY